MVNVEPFNFWESKLNMYSRFMQNSLQTKIVQEQNLNLNLESFQQILDFFKTFFLFLNL